jgi:uncharacterized protein (DUF305 family)
VGALLLLLAAAGGCSLGGGDSAEALEPATSTDGTSSEQTGNVVQPGAPGEPSTTLSAQELEAIETPEATAADIAFMQDMIHHHAQALRMARYVPERAQGPDIPLFTERLRVSQEDEIAMMARWLEAQGEEAFDVHDADELMPGMLSEPELERMEAASGREFNRLFLEGMIRHHQGALVMVAELYAAGGGVESQIDAFARHVEADQQIEIVRMQTLLAELDER